jgi:hypothetical protein
MVQSSVFNYENYAEGKTKFEDFKGNMFILMFGPPGVGLVS